MRQLSQSTTVKSGSIRPGQPQSGTRGVRAVQELCAAEIMDTIPAIIRYIRKQISGQNTLQTSVTQVRVLAFLTRFPGSSLSEVAEHLGVTKATASATIERMVKSSLVDRAEDPKERRCVVLRATKAGKDLYSQAHRIAQDAVADVIADLPADKLAAITEALATLRAAFDDLD